MEVCWDDISVCSIQHFNSRVSFKEKSTLKKKSQSIAYHFICKGAAKDEWRTAYVSTHLNPADLLTKPLPSREKRWRFIGMILHHLQPTQPMEY
jgi:hypothetical protein